MPKRNSSRRREPAHFPAFETGAPKSNAAVTGERSFAPFKQLLKRLSEAFGPSGSEEPVRALVRDEIKGWVDQVRVDALGNLIALRRGQGSHRKKIMLAAPLDEIGVMVTFIDSRGFARVNMLGGVKPLTLLGARVQFENGALGICGRDAQTGSRTQINPETLFLDTGATSPEDARVRVGDAACFAREFVDAGELLIGKALRDRAGCAVLIELLRQLKKSPHDLYCVFTVQHKVGARSASAAAYAIQPDLAFVVEAAAANDYPGGDANAIALGKGPVVKVQDEGMMVNRSTRQTLLNAAREARIPIQLEARAHSSGDAAPIQATREGVATGALGLPLRYENTASEMIHDADAQNAVRLLLALSSRALSVPFSY